MPNSIKNSISDIIFFFEYHLILNGIEQNHCNRNRILMSDSIYVNACDGHTYRWECAGDEDSPDPPGGWGDVLPRPP